MTEKEKRLSKFRGFNVSLRAPTKSLGCLSFTAFWQVLKGLEICVGVLKVFWETVKIFKN